MQKVSKLMLSCVVACYVGGSAAQQVQSDGQQIKNNLQVKTCPQLKTELDESERKITNLEDQIKTSEQKSKYQIEQLEKKKAQTDANGSIEDKINSLTKYIKDKENKKETLITERDQLKERASGLETKLEKAGCKDQSEVDVTNSEADRDKQAETSVECAEGKKEESLKEEVSQQLQSIEEIVKADKNLKADLEKLVKTLNKEILDADLFSSLNGRAERLKEQIEKRTKQLEALKQQ